MTDNRNLIRAKKARNDEFFTRVSDVAAELSHYPGAFAGKSVYLPCDTVSSAFWLYLIDNADALGWRELACTSMVRGGSGSYARAVRTRPASRGGIHIEGGPLSGDGDFLSPECLSFLDACDIVATNLPFSSFSRYVSEMLSRGKDFLVLGSKNAVKYKGVIGGLVSGSLRLGANDSRGSMVFDLPGGGSKRVPAYWYTTLCPDASPEPFRFACDFCEASLDAYANFDALNADSLSDIPDNYYGPIGVPLSFACHLDPSRWLLLGSNATLLEDSAQDPSIRDNTRTYRRHSFYIASPDGTYRRTYDRLVVQRLRPVV